MYFCNLFGFAFCLIVLMGSKCAANWQNKRGQEENGQYPSAFSVTRTKVSSYRAECRDSVTAAYCVAIKRREFCDVPFYQNRCKMTCGVCAAKTVGTECRDIGTEGFCNSIKGICKRHRLPHILKYCRKTCGLCASQAVKEEETLCVDRPICERLASVYKISFNNCNALTNPKIRKRALRKCPQFCGICVAKKSQSEVARKLRPVVDIVEAPKVILKSTIKNRPPHPPIESSDDDNQPRRGVFYIYTKFLSLRRH